MKKVGYFRVKQSGCSPEIMSGHELSSLQRIGVNLKILRKANEEEIKNIK